MALLKFSGIEKATGELNQELPPGIYEVMIVNPEVVMTKADSKNPNHPMLKLTMRVVSTEQNGRTLFENVMLPEGLKPEDAEFSNNKMKAILNAAGVRLDGQDLETADLQGLQFKVEVAHKKDRQDPTKMRARIENYISVLEPAPGTV